MQILIKKIENQMQFNKLALSYVLHNKNVFNMKKRVLKSILLYGIIPIALIICFGCFRKTRDKISNELELDIKRNITIPVVDISGVVIPGDLKRHVIISSGAEEEDWQHPHTLLMPDGKTMFAVWTHDHGGKAGPLKRSDDGGLTWSDLLDVPENWASVRDCPTIHRLVDQKGIARLFVFTGVDTLQQSISEDGGKTWSSMKPNGWIGIVAPHNVLPVEDGNKHLAWFHSRSGFIQQSASSDGGLTWEKQIQPLDQSDFTDARLVEPSVIRSPDEKQMLMLIRESNRCYNSLFSISDDEGETWSKPHELPAALTGDRHAPIYAPDGRLVIAMREIRPMPEGVYTSKSERNGKIVSVYTGHPVAWVGRYEDILENREGEYIIKLFHQHQGSFGYQQMERLPDETLIVTTYLRYRPGEKHSIVSTRFKLDELDKRLRCTY